MKLAIGNSVAVKPGTIDPDFDVDISGWRGRIEEIDREFVLIRWDSPTLKQMPKKLIIDCENENLDWEVMNLYKTDVEITTERDSKTDTAKMAMQIKLQIMGDPLLNDDDDDDDD